MSHREKGWLGALPANSAEELNTIGNCSVHSTGDEWNEYSDDGADPSAAMVSEQASCMPSSVTETGNCDVHSNSNDWSVPPGTDVVALNAGWNAHSIEIVHLGDRVIPTQETFGPLQVAFDYFNWQFFDNALPNPLITLTGRSGTYAYYVPDGFVRNDGRRTDKLAINAQYFGDGPEEILATLVYQMCLVWQEHCGSQHSRRGYKNAEWAKKMLSIGLIPGKEGGKQTGDSVSYDIEPDGRFARSVEQLLASGFQITWAELTAESASSRDSNATGQAGGRGSLSGKRTKYTCPYGDLNAWAKPGAKLVCGEHWARMEPALRRPQGKLGGGGPEPC